MTDLNIMIEVAWSGKMWLDLHAQKYPLKIKYWRKLPAFDTKTSIKKPKKSICRKTNSENVVKFRRVQRVIYNKLTGKIQCI